MKRLTAQVFGTVQGVGYRVFVQGVATKLGLNGYARNCGDGSVEVVVEGSEAALDLLLESLRRGPVGARVSHLETVFSEATGEFTGFFIR